MAQMERQAKVVAKLYELNRTQKDLAKELGMTPATLNMLLSGRLVALPQEKQRIADALGMEVRHLFDG